MDPPGELHAPLPDARARSGRRRRWRSGADGRARGLDATARASTCCARRSPRRSRSPPERSASSTWSAPAATATTAPTTPPSTPRCWRWRCPGRAGAARSGRAPTSTAGSPTARPALVELRAVLDDDGRIADWSHDAWGTTHLRAADGRRLAEPARRRPPRPAARAPRAAAPSLGQRGRDPPQRDADLRAPAARGSSSTSCAAMPLRTSSLRSLGAYANVFAIESFIDELAAPARRLAARLPPRATSRTPARARCSRAAAELAGWSGAASAEFGRGCGVGAGALQELGRLRGGRGPRCASTTRRRRSRSSGSRSPPTAARWSTRAARSTSSRAGRCSRRAGR